MKVSIFTSALPITNLIYKGNGRTGAEGAFAPINFQQPLATMRKVVRIEMTILAKIG